MPGVRGPAQTPTTPLEAIAPLNASHSNQSSSRSPTDMVMIRKKSMMSRLLSPAARPASRSRPNRSPGWREPRTGGGRSIIGRRKSPIRSSSAENAG